MAKYYTMTEEQKQAWAQWVSERPQVIKDMVEKYNLSPDTLYKLKSTGQNVYVASFSEDGTVTVVVREDLNRAMMLPFGGLLDIKVFGIDPADLQECDLPEGYVIDFNRRE